MFMIDRQGIYFALSNAAIIVLSIILLGGVASLIRTFSIRTYTVVFGPRMAQFIDTKLTFIGVIHHELSHFILAILTGAKVKQLRLINPKDGTLGSVDIVPRGPLVIRLLQQSLSGLAPVFCGAITLYIIYYYGIYGTKTVNYMTILLVIIAMCISYHMSMSKQDMKIAAGGLWLLYLLIVLISFFIKIDYLIYRSYLITILGIMGINLFMALVVKLISLIKN